MSSLLRSTKFVRYFAGAARTLILNSAKTAETNLLLNSKAICVANNVLMRDYATSKQSENIEPLLQKLDNEVRRFGRISKKDIDEVFDEIRAKNNITSSQSLLVIRCCGELVPEELPEQRTLLVQKIWSVLTERGVPMDISHYNALLRVYIENEHLFSPAEFLNELEKKGLQPNRVTYQRLMWRYCHEGDVEGATKVLEKMRELSLPVSEPVLNALVMGHAFHGDTDGATAVLETMAKAGLQPSNRTYTLLACGFAKKGDIASIENILNKANEKDIVYTDKDILDIVEALAVSGHGDKIETMFNHLQKSVGYTQEACNLILRLINKGHENLAKIMMKTLPRAENAEDNMYKGAFFVKQLLKVQKSPETIVKICRELQEEHLIPKALYIATEAALQQGQTEVALTLFKELQKDGTEIRQHYYWPLLVKKGKENDEEGLLQILREMANLGISPSGEALRDYVLPYLRQTDSPQNVMVKLQIANIPRIHSARNLMVELLETGNIKDAAAIALQYRPYGQYALISRPLINALSKTKDVVSFATVLHIISSKAINPEEQKNDETADDTIDSNEIGRIVKSAVKNIPISQCEELLTEVLSRGLRISISSAEEIQQYLGQNLSPDISEKLAQLTSPDLEIQSINNVRRNSNTMILRTSVDLEKLIATNEGGNNGRIQKQLLNAYVLENQVEKLTSYLKSLELDKFELSNATIAQLCEFYALHDDIEKSLHYKQLLDTKEPKFILNKYKLVNLAYAMVRANRFDEAVKFLKENRSEQDMGGLFMINSKSWQMLNALAEAKDVEKVKEMTKVLIEEKYIEPSNVLLGPCIKVHLLRDDIESALKEFETSCKQYRCTPWKGELMKTLILKEDASKLQWVADLSTQIHGEVNILHDLVLAFVECGRLRQARRILETPGMQTRQKRLDVACERYVQEGKPEYLEGLLEATRELSYIDRANIFYHLLKSYCKQMETDKALGLWTLLQEEGEVPSDEFLKNLAHHLKANNREVPFAVPSEPKQLQPKKQKSPSEANTNAAKSNESKPFSKKTVTDKLEHLIKEEKLTEAVTLMMSALKHEVMPRYNVIKYLLKNLAEQGQVEVIEKIGNSLSETLRRNVTFDDKLTLALFKKGSGPKHVEELYQAVESAQTEDEIAKAIVKFPRSNALASIIQNNELVSKCHKVAEIAASKGYYMPANLLWIEYLLTRKDKEADSLWNQYLKNAPLIAYRRFLQESHSQNQPQLVEKLLTYLKDNSNTTPSILGNVYSRLINLHTAYSNTEDAKITLEKALADGVTLENLSTSSLTRLKSALEAIGQEFKYTIPAKSNQKV